MGAVMLLLRKEKGIWQKSKSKNYEEKAKKDKSAYTKAKNYATIVIGTANEIERSRWVDADTGWKHRIQRKFEIWSR
jgi:hypothetical protein